MSIYPKDLIPILKQKWEQYKELIPALDSALPPSADLRILLDVAYHASFLTEEKRKPGFRIIYYSRQEYEKNSAKIERHDQNYSRLLRLDDAIPYTASEINRLAPAAELTRLIICITNESKDPKTPDLRIWGMLDVGENWWKFIHHETDEGRCPPGYLTITSSNSGELSLSIQGFVLLTLRDGQIFHPVEAEILCVHPVARFLAEAKQQLSKDVLDSLGLSTRDLKSDAKYHSVQLYESFLDRILFYVRQKRHGGTVLIIPSQITKDNTRLTDLINIKYKCSYDYAWNIIVRSLVNECKYYDLHFPFWDGKRKITKDLFRDYSIITDDKQEFEEALSDAAQAIAALTSVDGAVLMTDRLHVIGFGAEVIAISPSLKEIVIVTMPENRRTPIESYGTRHRAAFRFCSSLEDALAFVVSSDGGVKVVKRVRKDVFLWPDINTGSIGL